MQKMLRITQSLFTHLHFTHTETSEKNTFTVIITELKMWAKVKTLYGKREGGRKEKGKKREKSVMQRG